MTPKVKHFISKPKWVLNWMRMKKKNIAISKIFHLLPIWKWGLETRKWKLFLKLNYNSWRQNKGVHAIGTAVWISNLPYCKILDISSRAFVSFRSYMKHSSRCFTNIQTFLHLGGGLNELDCPSFFQPTYQYLGIGWNKACREWYDRVGLNRNSSKKLPHLCTDSAKYYLTSFALRAIWNSLL